MTLQRGDIGLTRFPHAGGNRGKKRPAVIIQAGITQVIGQLSDKMRAQLDACLKAALQLP